jgi:hypothetical protein
MAYFSWGTQIRAAAAAGVALALGACASTPAPIAPPMGPTPRSGPSGVSEFDPGLTPRVTDPQARLQCVPYARNASGVQIYGNANTWWAQASGRYPRSNLPAVGSVFVMRGYRDTSRGHVAVVSRIESDRVIRVNHANWLNNGEISEDVPVLDVSPGNDWSEVRVWYIPGGHWGGRIYQAEGFIHAFALYAGPVS